MAETLWTIHLVAAGLFAGGMVMELAMVIPSLRAVSPAAAAEAHANLSPRALRLFVPLSVVAIAAGIFALVVEHDDETSVTLEIVGLALWVVALGVTRLLYLPMVKLLDERVAAGRGLDDPDVLARWYARHAVRATIFVVGLVCFVVAALLR